jgi:hypothetical protein
VLVSGTMRDDRGHLRSVRLLPFAAAAGDSLTLSMQTSCIAVDKSRWCRSETFDGQIESLLCAAVAALWCCTLLGESV